MKKPTKTDIDTLTSLANSGMTVHVRRAAKNALRYIDALESQLGMHDVRGTDTELNLELVEGPEGLAVYLNDYRIAGPKPWGGGTLMKKFRVKGDKIQLAFGRAGGPKNDN